jgi:hypothetical protein
MSKKYWCDKQKNIVIPDKIKKLFLILWGSKLYLNYDSLQDNVNVNKIVGISSHINKLIDSFDEGEVDEDVDEFLGEGGNGAFGKNLVDMVFLSLTEKTSKSIKLYRTYNWDNMDIDYKGWVSCTQNKGSYSYLYNAVEKEFVLPIGFPIINTVFNGENLCDNNEIIVRFEDLININK